MSWRETLSLRTIFIIKLLSSYEYKITRITRACLLVKVKNKKTVVDTEITSNLRSQRDFAASNGANTSNRLPRVKNRHYAKCHKWNSIHGKNEGIFHGVRKIDIRLGTDSELWSDKVINHTNVISLKEILSFSINFIYLHSYQESLFIRINVLYWFLHFTYYIRVFFINWIESVRLSHDVRSTRQSNIAFFT